MANCGTRFSKRFLAALVTFCVLQLDKNFLHLKLLAALWEVVEHTFRLFSQSFQGNICCLQCMLNESSPDVLSVPLSILQHSLLPFHSKKLCAANAIHFCVLGLP